MKSKIRVQAPSINNLSENVLLGGSEPGQKLGGVVCGIVDLFWGVVWGIVCGIVDSRG